MNKDHFCFGSCSTCEDRLKRSIERLLGDNNRLFRELNALAPKADSPPRSRNWDLLAAINKREKPMTIQTINCPKCDEKISFVLDEPPKEDSPLLDITQVKELLDNLELSGFSHSEAMAIVLKVVGRG